jgi:hypothetical protein
MRKRIPNAARINALQERAVRAWHRGRVFLRKGDPFEVLAVLQHRFNHELWHQEDEARRRDVSNTVIASIKRTIDKLNQGRNDFIERLDVYVVNDLKDRNITVGRGAVLNSETPGSIIDRLSIINLRIYHMLAETRRQRAARAHRAACRAKLKVLLEQKRDLAACLGRLLRDIYAGRKRIKVYRQFKMYNDPGLNPALYGSHK